MIPKIILAVIIILAIYIIIKLLKKGSFVKNETFEDYLKKINPTATLNKLKTNEYEINTNENEYLVKIIKIPEFAEIQINSKNTWELKYGAGQKPGKLQPYKRYLTEIKDFTLLSTEKQKVVIFYPTPKKIVKYINECEIIFVSPTTDVYGMHVTSFDNLDEFKNK